MDFNFDFNCLKKGAPIVTLSASGISCNIASIKLLDSPEFVKVGFDETQMALGIKEAEEKEEGIITYSFASRIKSDWVKIGARGFLDYLSRLSGIDFISKSKQFVPELDEKTKTLIIYVDKEHMKEVN